MMRLALLLGFSSVFGLAETWSGVLVDSKCWINEERNVNPTDTTLFADRDRNLEIRYCAPTPKTKSFVIVPPDGVGLQLDARGNSAAVDLVRTAGKQSMYRVAVTGDRVKDTVTVASISTSK